MIIEGKILGKTSTGNDMTTFTIDGKKFNVFGDDFKEFNVGDVVNITTKQDGKYTNLDTMEMGTLNPVIAGKSLISTNNGTIHNTSQSSYEFGKASNRHKVYYNSVAELVDKIEYLKGAGLVDSDDVPLEPVVVKPEDFLKENER